MCLFLLSRLVNLNLVQCPHVATKGLGNSTKGLWAQVTTKNPTTWWRWDPRNESQSNSHFHSRKERPNARASDALHVCDAKQMFSFKSDSDPFISQCPTPLPWALTFYDCTVSTTRCSLNSDYFTIILGLCLWGLSWWNPHIINDTTRKLFRMYTQQPAQASSPPPGLCTRNESSAFICSMPIFFFVMNLLWNFFFNFEK